VLQRQQSSSQESWVLGSGPRTIAAAKHEKWPAHIGTLCVASSLKIVHAIMHALLLFIVKKIVLTGFHRFAPCAHPLLSISE